MKKPLQAKTKQSPSEVLPELEQWTSFLLRQATLRAQQKVSQNLETLNLNPPHNTVLTMLGSGPMSQIALSAKTKTDRTTMVGIVDELEEMGLVSRASHATDRRVHAVTLTRVGIGKLSQANAKVTAADEAFLKPLSEKERQTLRNLLTKLIQAHDQELREP